MAAAQPASPGATTLGDVSLAVNALNTAASELFDAYENDASAYSLADRAGDIRSRAATLEDLFNNIGAALSNLGS